MVKGKKVRYFMSLLHRTKEYTGYGKQNYYHNEYMDEGDRVVKYKCHEYKSFDGRENTWHNDRSAVESWDKKDSSMPDWLRNKL